MAGEKYTIFFDGVFLGNERCASVRPGPKQLMTVIILFGFCLN
jgi:hypothetical protein